MGNCLLIITPGEVVWGVYVSRTTISGEFRRVRHVSRTTISGEFRRVRNSLRTVDILENGA